MNKLNFRWFRFNGIITVAILWLSVGLGMYRENLGFFDARPLSYLGTADSSKLLFSGGLILAAVSTSLFGWYLKDRFQLNVKFLSVVLVGQLAQVIVALAPYGMESTTRRIHTISAFVLAFSIPLLMHIFARGQTGSLAKLANWFFWVELIAFSIGIGWFVFTNNAAPISQILTALVFHVWLISLSLKS